MLRMVILRLLDRSLLFPEVYVLGLNENPQQTHYKEPGIPTVEEKRTVSRKNGNWTATRLSPAVFRVPVVPIKRTGPCLPVMAPTRVPWKAAVAEASLRRANSKLCSWSSLQESHGPTALSQRPGLTTRSFKNLAYDSRPLS